MFNQKVHVFFCAASLAVCLSLMAASSAVAQTEGLGQTAFESMRGPLKVSLSGFVDTQPAEDSLAVVQLRIGLYRESRQFDVVNLQAVDRPRITPIALLGGSKGREVTFDMIGPQELLAKVIQAEPGTPLKLVGFLQPRGRKITLTNVDIVGF